MRHCSYCASLNHNIRNCNNFNINLMFNSMQQKFTIYLQERGRDNCRFYFTSWLSATYHLVELKVVAVTRYFASARLNKIQYAEIIWQNLNDLNIYRQQDTPTPTQEEKTLDWYIDREPSTPIYNTRRRIQLLDNTFDNTIDNTLELAWTYHSQYIRDLFNPEHLINSMINELDELDNTLNLNTTKFNIKPLLVEEEKNIEDMECSICYELTKTKDIVKLNCDHKFCGNCLEHILSKHNNMYKSPCCALCRTTITNVTCYDESSLNSIKQYCN
jgi:hypothetical protein